MKDPSLITKSLSNLANILGIDSSQYGWKTQLAQWFEVDTGMLSNWIKRGIPKSRIESTIKKGYPPEKWLVSKSAPGSTISHEDGVEVTKPHVIATGIAKHLSHGEIIEQFKDKNLAMELNMILLAIEYHDPEILQRDIKSFLQGILTALEAKKKANGP